MILTRLTAVGNDGSRVMLWFDDGSRTRVPVSVVTELGLYGGMELSGGDLEKLMETAQKVSARDRAVRIVSAANISEKELRRRLVQKGERPQDAAEAVEYLRKLGAVDDESVARQVVRRCAAKGYGKNRVRQEFSQKGVPRQYWDAALADYPDMAGSIDQFLARRFQGEETLDRKTIEKAAAALSRRGHSWADISAGLKRYQEREL